MRFLLPLLWACRVTPPDERPTCRAMRHSEVWGNHVMPFEVVADTERRKVWSASIASPNVAEVDMDQGTLADVHAIAGNPLVEPDLALGTDGVLWLASGRTPAMFRFDPDDGEAASSRGLLVSARAVAPFPGGAVFLGDNDAGDTTLAVVDAALEPIATLVLAETGHGFIRWGDTAVGVLVGSEIQVLELPFLGEVERCGLPFEARAGVRLDDGTAIVASQRMIGRAACGSDEGRSWQEGEENKEVVAEGDRAWVLDKAGSAEGADPNLGVAREVTRDGPTGRWIATGKNSGSGAMADGTLWVNSEGTAEVWSMDPDTGAMGLRVRTGTWLDGLALDDGDTDTVFATGRLSNTLASLDAASLETRVEVNDVRWPYSPVVDSSRDAVWVLSQTDGTLHARRRGDLTALLDLDPGLGPNDLLTFGTIAMHSDRGTLFFAHSALDALVEVDPESGSTLARWDLGGPAVEDRDEIGELRVMVDPTGGAVLVARSNDGRLSRVVPGRSDVHTVWLNRGLGDDGATDSSMLLGRDRLVWHGRFAFDARTLEREPDRDLPVTRMLGPFPSREGWVGADTRDHVIARLDRDVRTASSVVYASEDVQAAVFRLDSENDRVLMTRARDAIVCSFPLDWLR